MEKMERIPLSKIRMASNSQCLLTLRGHHQGNSPLTLPSNNRVQSLLQGNYSHGPLCFKIKIQNFLTIAVLICLQNINIKHCLANLIKIRHPMADIIHNRHCQTNIQWKQTNVDLNLLQTIIKTSFHKIYSQCQETTTRVSPQSTLPISTSRRYM